MTVDEALADLYQSMEMGWRPGVEAVSVLSRYVERVREIEHDLATPLAPYRQTVRMKLAAAWEGRDE